MEQSVTSIVDAVRASGRRPTVTAVCRVLVVDLGLRNSPETLVLALAAVEALGLRKPKDSTLGDLLMPGRHTAERAEVQCARLAKARETPEGLEKHRASSRAAQAKLRATPEGREKQRAAYAKLKSTPEGLEKHRASSRAAQAKIRATPEGLEKHRAAQAKLVAAGKIAAYQTARYRDDFAFRIRKIASTRILAALRYAKRGLRKSAKTMDLLDCTVTEFMAHLEARFAEGMTWENHGTAWHVDHVVPVAAFDLTTDEGQRAAFHYTNCQPLWAEDNLSKGSLHDGVRRRHGG